MKSNRFLALLCTTVLLGTSLPLYPAAADSEYIAPPPTTFATRINAGDIVLDGKLDETIWQALDNSIDKKNEATPPNNESTYALAWDDEALYVGVRVKDANLIADKTLTDNAGTAVEVPPYRNDCIEVYVDPDFDKAYDERTVHLILEGPTGQAALMGGTDMWGQPVAYSDFANMCSHSLTDSGYIGEFRIPFSAMGINAPRAGKAMGFAICVKDKDVSGTGAEEVYTVDGFAADDPLTWGQLYLSHTEDDLIANPGTPEIDGSLGEAYRWDFTRTFAENGFAVNVGTLCDADNLYLAFDFNLLDENDAFANYKLGKFWLFLAGDNDQSADGKSANKHDIEIAVNPPKKRFTTLRAYYPTASGKEPYSKDVPGSGKMNARFVQDGASLKMEFQIPWESFCPDRHFLNDMGWEVALENFLGYTGTLFGCEDPWNMNKGYGTIVSNNAKVSIENSAPTAVTTLYSYSIAEGRTISGKLDIKDPDGDSLTYSLTEPFVKNSQGLFEVNSKTGEWKYTPPYEDFTAESLNYFIMADDGFGGQFRTRVEIRVLNAPTYITWHVDGDNGRDNNDGRTPETAFKTLTKAHQMTNPGDTVLIYNSKTPYLSKGPLKITRSGLPGAYITYKAAPGHEPVLNADDSWNTIVVNASYIILEHLNIEGIADEVNYDMAWDIMRGTAANATKAEKRARLKYDAGIANTNGISVDAAKKGDGTEASPDEKIVPNHIIIRDCTFSKLAAAGIGFARCDYVIAENNTVTNCCWWDMYACSGISALGMLDIDDNTDEHKIIIRNNYVAGNRHFMPWVTLDPIRLSDGNGIIIDSTTAWDYRPKWRAAGYTWPIFAYAGRTLVANNLCYENGGSGIHCFEAEHVDLINNTVYSNVACTGLDYSDFYGTPANDINMFNNIVYSRTNAKMMIAGTSNNKFAYDNNLFYNYDPERNNLGDTLAGRITVGKNNIYGQDPLFTLLPIVDNSVDESEYPDTWPEAKKLNALRSRYSPTRNYDITQYAADFTLQSNSPALNTGNAEWSAKVGNTDNRLGIFGTIGARAQTDSIPANIQDALAAADAVQSGIILGISENEVLTGVKFVTEEVMNALNDAKSAAYELSATASQEEIDRIADAIVQATADFQVGIRTGVCPLPELVPDEVSKDLWIISNAGTPVIDGITNEDYSWDYVKKAAQAGYTLKIASMCDTEYLYVAYNIKLDSGSMEDKNRGEVYLFFAGDNNQSPRSKSTNRHDFELSLNLMEDKFNTLRIYDLAFEDSKKEPYDYGNIPAIEKIAGKFHVEGDTLSFEVAVPWETFKPDREYNDKIGWEVYLSDFLGRWGTVIGNPHPWSNNEGYGVILLNNGDL